MELFRDIESNHVEQKNSTTASLCLYIRSDSLTKRAQRILIREHGFKIKSGLNPIGFLLREPERCIKKYIIPAEHYSANKYTRTIRILL